jgi:hypothetical protein
LGSSSGGAVVLFFLLARANCAATAAVSNKAGTSQRRPRKDILELIARIVIGLNRSAS